MDRRSLPKPSRRNLSLLKIKDLMDKGSIYLNASYQRGVVWSEDQMSDMIDSILQDVYIPPLLFSNQNTANGKLRICIDGKQRLTTIYRFMRNETPYIDRRAGVDVKKYYSQALDAGNANIASIISQTPRRYLTAQEVTKVNKAEIIFVEYNGLTEDEEYEQFSRINEGQAFTTEEKLMTHNSPVAKITRQLTEDYPEVSLFLTIPRKTHRYRFIAEALYHLRNGGSEFKYRINNIENFVCEKNEYPPLLLEKVERALSIITTMVQDDTFVRVLKHHPTLNSKLHATRIELFIFTYYLCLRPTHLGMSDLSEDFRNLRVQMRGGESTRVETNKANWLKGMTWVQNKLREKEEALRQSRQYAPRQNTSNQNIFDDDSEIDELKSDDNSDYMEDEPPARITVQSRRDGALQGMGRGTRKPPTARRGGRAPMPE